MATVTLSPVRRPGPIQQEPARNEEDTPTSLHFLRPFSTRVKSAHRRLTIHKLFAWLSAKEQDAYVGMLRDPQHCLVATCIQECFGLVACVFYHEIVYLQEDLFEPMTIAMQQTDHALHEAIFAFDRFGNTFVLPPERTRVTRRDIWPVEQAIGRLL